MNGIKNAVIEPDATWLVKFPDGRIYRDGDVSVTEDEFRRMYQGYMCANCYEPFTSPYPEVCTLPGCGFRVKDEQRARLDEQFGGEKWLGPSPSTLARLDNEIDKALSPTKTGIWVPERSNA
jgi:hypothetical protein